MSIGYCGIENNDEAFIAVKQSGFVLRYIRDQTLEICMEAVKQDGAALQYVRDRKMYNDIKNTQ